MGTNKWPDGTIMPDAACGGGGGENHAAAGGRAADGAYDHVMVSGPTDPGSAVGTATALPLVRASSDAACCARARS